MYSVDEGLAKNISDMANDLYIISFDNFLTLPVFFNQGKHERG